MLLFLSSLNVVMSASNTKSDGARQDYPNRLDLSRLIKSQNVEDSYDALKKAISKIEYRKEFLSDSSDKGVKAKIQFLKKLLECEIVNGEINFDEYNDEFIEPKELFSLLIKEELLDEIKNEVFKLNYPRDAILKLRELEIYLESFKNNIDKLCRNLDKLHLKLKNSKCLKLRLWDSKSFKLIVVLKKEFNETTAKYSGFEDKIKNFKTFFEAQTNENKNTLRGGDQGLKEEDNPVSSEHFMETIFFQEAFKTLRDGNNFKSNLGDNLKMIERSLEEEEIKDQKITNILDFLYEVKYNYIKFSGIQDILENEFCPVKSKYIKAMNSDSNNLFKYLLNETERLSREVESILSEDIILELLCRKVCIVIEKKNFDIIKYFELKLSGQIMSSYEKAREDFIQVLRPHENCRNTIEELIEKLVFKKFEDVEISSDGLACLSLVSRNMSLESEALFYGLSGLHVLLYRNMNDLNQDLDLRAVDVKYPFLAISLASISEKMRGAKFNLIYFEYYGNKDDSFDNTDVTDKE